jgi:hypothetical protein
VTDLDFERCLIRAAFLEWRVAKAYSTGSTIEIEPRRPRGKVFVSSVLSASWPPAKFVRDELGFALDSGPSLAWTCKMLAKTNRDALKILARDDVPLRVTYPRGALN